MTLWRWILVVSTLMWMGSMFLPVIERIPGVYALYVGCVVPFDPSQSAQTRLSYLAALIGNATILPAMLVTLRYAKVCKIAAPAMGVGFAGAAVIGIMSSSETDSLRAGYYLWCSALGVSFVGCVLGSVSKQ